MKEQVGEKAKLQESLFSLADVNDIWYKVIKQVFIIYDKVTMNPPACITMCL